MTEPLTRGAHHIGLTVPDLGAARAFFIEALGFKLAGEMPDYPAAFVSDGHILLTLWQAAEPASAVPFDRRRNIGLHHLALAVPDEDALVAAFERVRSYPGVSVECPPEPMRSGATTLHCIFAIPGGVRIELATPFA